MASLMVEPLRHEDLDEHIRLYWAAFQPEEADMIAPMVWPGGLTPELMERFRERLRREYPDNLGELCFSAKDASGNIVAVSRWAINDHPANTREEVDAQLETARRNRNAGPPLPDMNQALHDAWLQAMVYSEYETMRGQPYISLRLLATHPEHQRKGAGTLLLEDGLTRFADRPRLPVYLDAAKSGKPLYERYGFTVQRLVPFDGREYGGRSEARHWCMLRPAPVWRGSETV